jgi:prepilin signal peptidase PulO-like enzyme (type II secretory pathway)
LVEFITAILFVLIFLNVQPSVFYFRTILETAYLLAVFCFLIPIFFIDLKHYIIPDKFVFSLIILSLIFNAVFDFFNWQSGLIADWTGLNSVSGILSAILAGGLFSLIILISKGKWMGVGDAKFAIFMGLFLGFPKILCALFLAFALGAIIGVGLIALRKKGFGSEIPFGPFLTIGTAISFFLGNQIINWYLSLIV